MKTINYNGACDTPSSCQYTLAELLDTTVLIFYTENRDGTFISNAVESATNAILCKDLRGTNPENIRIFTVFNQDSDPFPIWSEIKFKDIYGNIEKEGATKKLLGKILNKEKVAHYAVDNPEWLNVSETEIEILSNHLKENYSVKFIKNSY